MIDELYEREYKPRYPQLTRDEVGKLLEASADGSGKPFPDILDKANKLKSEIMAEASHLIPRNINGYPIKVSVELEPKYNGHDLADILSVRFSGSLHRYGHVTAFGELHTVTLRDMDDEFTARYTKTMMRETWRHMANTFIETANKWETMYRTVAAQLDRTSATLYSTETALKAMKNRVRKVEGTYIHPDDDDSEDYDDEVSAVEWKARYEAERKMRLELQSKVIALNTQLAAEKGILLG